MVKKELLLETGVHGFKVHTVGLLREIVDCGLRDNMGVLKIPLNILTSYLESIAQMATELNDPIMNKLMCDMALYEESDQYSKEFDEDLMTKVNKLYKEELLKNKN